MDIKVKFDAVTTLMALERSPQQVANHVRMALLESCRLVQGEARGKHSFRTKTGLLERSVSYSVDSSKCEGTIEIDESVALYGKFIHEGTGIHGPKHKEYPIAPKNKKSLRWVGPGGRFFYSKGHNIKGIKPDRFLYEAAERSRAKINEIFLRHNNQAIKEAGL